MAFVVSHFILSKDELGVNLMAIVACIPGVVVGLVEVVAMVVRTIGGGTLALFPGGQVVPVVFLAKVEVIVSGLVALLIIGVVVLIVESDATVFLGFIALIIPGLLVDLVEGVAKVVVAVLSEVLKDIMVDPTRAVILPGVEVGVVEVVATVDYGSDARINKGFVVDAVIKELLAIFPVGFGAVINPG